MAAAATLGPLLDHIVDPLNRNEPTTVTGMTRLPTRVAPLPGRPLTLRRPRWIPTGRPRGIARAPTKSPLELLDPRRQPGDHRVPSSYSLRQRHQHHNDSVAAPLENRLGLNRPHTTQLDTPRKVPPSNQEELNGYENYATPLPPTAEPGGKSRNKLYAYTDYLALLSEGMSPTAER